MRTSRFEPAPSALPCDSKWLHVLRGAARVRLPSPAVWEPKPAEWKFLLDALPKEDAEKVMKFKFVADQKRAIVSR